MTIETLTAREIVTQLAETIGQNINIMNTEGVIIASSDPEREGQLHDGARKLIAEQLPLLVVEDDVQYAGAKNGVNLPIMFENELVGTIGITGKVSEVLKYGQIIKRMTEILLLDSRIRERTVIEQKARDRFYDEWILGELEMKNEAEFRRMAEALAIDVSGTVRIAVLSVDFERQPEDDTYTLISRYIRQLLRSRLSGSAFRTATKMICILKEEKVEMLLPTFQRAAQELEFARIYLEENGSLIAIGERLFLHKNTVKYRIARLNEQTGVDIRTCRGAYIFTLALKFWNRLME